MLLSISHTSSYNYDLPVPYSVLRIRLTPQTSSVQTVHGWRMELDGAEQEADYADAFGNRTELVKAVPGARQIVIHATGQVQTEDTAGIFRPGTGMAPLWVFERLTPLTRTGDTVAALAESVRHHDKRLDLLHALAAEIHRRVAYEPGTTSVATEAESALRNGSGVCQDHAHVFIAAARFLRIPARYVSGYLLMEGVAEQVATHAWAEAFVEDLGWVGFDAANAVAPDEKYVRIACGLDYNSAAPITGMRTGAAAETLAVALHVEQ